MTGSRGKWGAEFGMCFSGKIVSSPIANTLLYSTLLIQGTGGRPFGPKDCGRTGHEIGNIATFRGHCIPNVRCVVVGKARLGEEELQFLNVGH